MKVYKNPDENSDGDEIPLGKQNIAVNSTSKNLLEITLPYPVATDEVYRLKLGAGAVNEEGKDTNVNKAIEPKKYGHHHRESHVFWIQKNKPYLSGQKIIVPFDVPISILDPKKIKYQLGDTTITPGKAPKVINNNQLEIPLDKAPVAGQAYSIQLAPGAVAGRNAIPSVAIQPDNKDIIAWDITAVKPVFTSDTEFSFTFPTNMEIVDESNIEVEVRADGEATFKSTSVSSRRVDATNRNFLNLTLSAAATNKKRL